MKKDYAPSAKKLVQALGGKDNITRVFHCMTRLRFYVKDRSKINEADIKKLPEISGVNWHQDQFQVIAGNEVNEMYAELVKMGVPNDDSDSSQKTAEKKSVGSAIIDSITGCMTPMIPALTAAGMIKVVLTLLTTFHLVNDTSSTYQVINFIGDAAFYFMPFLIAANAAKVFNVNQSLALIIAGVFLHPNFTAMIASGDPITFFSIPVTPTTYSYSVIPVILMVWIMSYIVKLVDRITPRIVKLILHPTLVILISAPIAIIAVGPLGGIIGDGLAVAIDFLSAKLGFIIVGILGAAFPFIVMTGMHHALTPIGLNAVATGGDTLIFVSQVCSNVAQGGAYLETARKCFRYLRSYGNYRAGALRCYAEAETSCSSRGYCSGYRRYRRRTSSGNSLYCAELSACSSRVHRRKRNDQFLLRTADDRCFLCGRFCPHLYLRIQG